MRKIYNHDKYNHRWGNKMKPNENTQEIEQERASYLLNLDDINYEMLADPHVIRNKSAMTPNSYIGVFNEINLNGLIYTEDSTEFTELIESQNQIEFPTQKFQQLRPVTLKDELAKDHSYSQ